MGQNTKNKNKHTFKAKKLLFLLMVFWGCWRPGRKFVLSPFNQKTVSSNLRTNKWNRNEIFNCTNPKNISSSSTSYASSSTITVTNQVSRKKNAFKKCFLSFFMCHLCEHVIWHIKLSLCFWALLCFLSLLLKTPFQALKFAFMTWTSENCFQSRKSWFFFFSI